MDTKGDDSGSDSLDQSLQKKCVVADDDSSPKQPDAAVREDDAAEELTTEPGGIMSDPKDSPASPSPPPSHSPTDNNTSDAVLVVVIDKDLPDENSNSSGKDDSRGFESKVRQISDDLKDTTLADENSLEKVDDRDVIKEEVESDTAPEVTLDDVKNDSDGYDSDRTITYESPSKKSSSSSSEKKKSKKITKKVRLKFHQGKVCSDDEGDDEGDDEDDESEDDVDDDDDDEGDEDDDDDEEDDDDDEDTLNEGGISKKIRIPLSFESAHDEEEDILSDEASAQLLAEVAEVQDPPPEGGVQKILGKVSQMGKVEYLFRWVNKPGLQWEREDVLKKLCPNLIKLYEKKRAKDREQDMHYVIRRKKVRKELIDV